MELFRGGLVFKADRLLYHSTLGLIVMKKQEGGHARGVACNRQLVFVESDASGPRIQGDSHTKTSKVHLWPDTAKVDMSRPLGCLPTSSHIMY